MKNNGVKKACVVSSSGIGDSYNKVSFILKGMIHITALAHIWPYLETMEARYDEATDLDICIVRPTLLTDGPLTGNVKCVPDLFGNHSISRADVAKWMIDESLKEGAFVVKKPLITSV